MSDDDKDKVAVIAVAIFLVVLFIIEMFVRAVV